MGARRTRRSGAGVSAAGSGQLANGAVVIGPAGADKPFKFFGVRNGVATVARCTGDGTVWPGSMPQQVPASEFAASWTAYVAPQRKHDPDAFD